MPASRLRCVLRDDVCEIRVLIRHPMDNGRMRDPVTGAGIPAHYIEHLSLYSGSRLLLDCTLSTALAKDPYLTFDYPEGRAGESITLRWRDNLGQHEEVKAQIESADA